MWRLLLELASWGRKYRGDFIAGSIAFLIPFLIGWSVKRFEDIITLTSLLGFIVAFLILLLGVKSCFEFLLRNFIKAKFKYPVEVGVLNGYLSKDKKGKLPGRPCTEYEPNDWFTAFSLHPEFRTSWITATEISNKYDIIINPFGEIYPEIDKPNLLTLRQITKYVRDGGVFVHVAGLAFYYLWDGDKQDLTGPLYETYKIDSIPGILIKQVFLKATHLLDSWLYKHFGIRTTFFDFSILDVYPVQDEYFKDLDKIGNERKVMEFRSAFRSEKDEAILIPC